MRKYIDIINENLTEMPISVNFKGDKDKEGSFRADDITLLHNPKGLEKIHKIWKSSVVDVDLYLIHSSMEDMRNKQDRYYDNETLRYRHFNTAVFKQSKILDDEYLNTIGIIKNLNNITCILTQNEGNERIPLTGWMIAHRLYHVLDIAGNRDITSTKKFQNYLADPIDGNSLWERINYIVSDYYPRDEGEIFSGIKLATLLPHNAIKNVFKEIGNSKTMRESSYTGLSEWAPETFAQYMLKGRVKFGRSTLVPELNSILEEAEQHLNIMCQNIINDSIGKAFIL